MGWRHTRVDSYGIMLTRRFLNLLQGRLALMNRDVWAFVLAKRCMGTETMRWIRVGQWGQALATLCCWKHGNQPSVYRSGKKDGTRNDTMHYTAHKMHKAFVLLLLFFCSPLDIKVWKRYQSDYNGDLPSLVKKEKTGYDERMWKWISRSAWSGHECGAI